MRSVVLLAGHRQTAGGQRWAALFLIVWGLVFAGGPTLQAYTSAQSPRPDVPLLPLLLGSAALLGGLYLALRRREVRLDPARGMVEETRRFLNSERTERTPLAQLERVLLETHRGSKGSTYYSLALRGPRERSVSLGGHFPERGDAFEAGMRAASATGLPLDEQDVEGQVVRLRAGHLPTLEAEAPAAEDGPPWWRRPSALALVAANLVPLAGVLFLRWEVLPLMLLFWLENLVIGAYTVARLLTARAGIFNLPLAGFFVFHYGMFCMVHGLFVMVLFGDRKTIGGFGPGMLLELVGDALFRHGLWIATVALAVSHGVSFVTNWLRTQAPEEADGRKLMLAPYKRIMVLHVVIIAGGGLVHGLGQPLLPLVMLVAAKIAIDLGAHLAEHRAPLVREYRTLAASIDEAQPPREDLNDKPLAHYLGTWRLAPGEHSPPGWFAGIAIAQAGGKLAVKLTSQPGAPSGEVLEGAQVRGDASRVEWLEVRLRGAGKRRVLRFTASGTDASRIELHEVQHPEGKPKAAQARSFSLVR